MYEGPTSSTESILSHSKISNNEAGMRHENGGGGVSMFPYTYLTISFTSFTGNRAKQGGAIQTLPSARLAVRHCMFAGNQAYIEGGAIASELATITVISSQFVSNIANGLGAAIHINQPVEIPIVDTTFTPYVDGALVVFIGGRLAG
jgi:predicted outer membrane repeat protein